MNTMFSFFPEFFMKNNKVSWYAISDYAIVETRKDRIKPTIIIKAYPNEHLRPTKE